MAFMQHMREVSAEPDRLVGYPDERPGDELTQRKILQEIEDDPAHLFAFAMMDGELIGTIELQWKPGRRRMAHVGSIGRDREREFVAVGASVGYWLKPSFNRLKTGDSARSSWRSFPRTRDRFNCIRVLGFEMSVVYVTKCSAKRWFL